MARPLRIELAGGVYHVTSRGDRREDIFLTDDDRRAWLKLLGDVCERFNWVCHGWCQMTNHYHVVLETVELFGVTQPRISDLMRGKINLFSLDMLMNMASTAGMSPVVKLSKPKLFSLKRNSKTRVALAA
jgi:hypothetical protein